MFYKVMFNNMVVDLLTEARWVRYLPNSKRLVATDSQAANGIMGSDHDTVYHLFGKPYTFDKEVKTVEVIKIDGVEYEKLRGQFMLQQQENESMKKEICSLREQLSSQEALLQAILAKLS